MLIYALAKTNYPSIKVASVTVCGSAEASGHGTQVCTHYAEVTVKKSQRGVIIMHIIPAANTYSLGIPGSRTAGWSMLAHARLLVGHASQRRVYFRTVRFTAGDMIGK
ncbi:hypothetical protein QOT17_023464 [Balamuthia mandrillaris]